MKDDIIELNQDADVECIDVSFFRPGKSGTLNILDDISFSVTRGTTLAIVGPSGCGKTTLLKLLLDIEKPQKGSILINNKHGNQRISYLAQEPILLPWRTAMQNATLGIEIDKELTAHHIDGLEGEFRKYELSGFENSLPNTLSGGMRQKVALISALARSPIILFCDEPFSAIDYVARMRLLNSFKSDCRALGSTIVIVTHNIEEAVFLADEVIVLSPRPAKIRLRLKINLGKFGIDILLARPMKEFNWYFNQIWDAIRRG